MKKRFESLNHIHLIPFLLCFAVSLGILLGVSSTGLFPSAFFSTTVTVILVYGLISLSRNLRRLFSLTRIPDPIACSPLLGPPSPPVS